MSSDQSTLVLPEDLERSKVKVLYEEAYAVYERKLNSVYQMVKNVLESKGIIPTIKYRVKRFETYFSKLIKNYRGDEHGGAPTVTDVLGLRIICPFLEDLETVENLIKVNFNVVELERKGSHYAVREFGYDSVHLLIAIDPIPGKQKLPCTSDVCEVQLRTILQDAWAEVEHELIYKSDITLPIPSIQRKLAALNATLTLSDLIFQEIRDHQKDIREHDRRRRQSLEAKLSSAVSIEKDADIYKNTDPQAITNEVNIIVGEANLEKALLSALEAHSGGQLENAIKIYTSILRLKIKDAVRSIVYNHRGMAYFGLSDYYRAIRDFSKSIEFDSANVRCYNNRALAFRVLKKYERSLEDYDRSIAIDPFQIDGFWGRAQTLYEMKLYSQSLADCQKALSIHGNFLPAQALLKRLNKLIF